jgi:hypothetical protein
MRRLIALLRALFRRRCPHKTLGWPRYRDGKLTQTCWDCGDRVPCKVEFAHRVIVRIER